MLESCSTSDFAVVCDVTFLYKVTENVLIFMDGKKRKPSSIPITASNVHSFRLFLTKKKSGLFHPTILIMSIHANSHKAASAQVNVYFLSFSYTVEESKMFFSLLHLNGLDE